MQIEITAKYKNSVALAINDESEITNVQILFDADEIDCEHYDCENPTAPYVLFIDWSPAQSIPAECLSHQTQALRDFVAAI